MNDGKLGRSCNTQSKYNVETQIPSGSGGIMLI